MNDHKGRPITYWGGMQPSYTGPLAVIEDPQSGPRMLAFALCMCLQAAIWFALGFVLSPIIRGWV